MSGNLGTVAKIKEPSGLDIKAGNYDPVVHFDLRDISMASIVGDDGEGPKPEYRVFSVSAGDYKIPYYLQIAHTTNIPLHYEVYKATVGSVSGIDESTGASGTTTATISGDDTIVVYNSPVDNKAHRYIYNESDNIDLKERNFEEGSFDKYGRKTAQRSGKYYSYESESVDGNPELYAVPIYLQTDDPIKNDDESAEHDYFVLKLTYDTEAAATKAGFVDWNSAKDNKETDIIYITAHRG